MVTNSGTPSKLPLLVAVELNGLIKHGFLNLEDIFADEVHFDVVEEIGTYKTGCVITPEAVVVLERASRFNIVAYRWRDDSLLPGCGDWTLDIEEAVILGQQYIMSR